MAIEFGPWLQILFQRPLRGGDKRVCLTLDDGPNGVATERVLSVLRTHDVHATFFLIGKNVERAPALARRIVGEGHQVGNHSYEHNPFLFLLPAAHMRRSLERASSVIEAATGTRPTCFRPPCALTSVRLNKVCAELQLTPIGVHVFVNDSLMGNANWMARLTLHQLGEASGVTVLHDGYGTWPLRSRAAVADALDIILPELRKRGYHWVNPAEFTFELYTTR